MFEAEGKCKSLRPPPACIPLAVAVMLFSRSRAAMRLRPVAGGAASLSRRAGAFAMGQRRAYQGNLQDGDRIFTNLYAVTTAMPSATKSTLTTCARVQVQ